MNPFSRPALSLLVMLATLSVPKALAQSGYHIIDKRFSLSGDGDGNWGPIAVDSATQRLYLPHGKEVRILDDQTGNIIGRITGTPGVRDVALDTFVHRGFTSNSADSSVTIFDTETFETLQNVKTSRPPASLLFDPNTERVFAMSEEVTAIDARTGKALGTIVLGGMPGAADTDLNGLVFTTLLNKGTIVVFDSNSLKTTHEYAVPGCKTPNTIATDPANRRLFIGCRNGRLVVLDADSGKRIASIPICNDVDTTLFDSGEDLIFNSCGKGIITLVQEHSPTSFSSFETVKTQEGTYTMAFDRKTHTLFLPNTKSQNLSTTRTQGSTAEAANSGSVSILIVTR